MFINYQLGEREVSGQGRTLCVCQTVKSGAGIEVVDVLTQPNCPPTLCFELPAECLGRPSELASPRERRCRSAGP